MSEIIQLAMTDCQNVKSLEQLSSGERFISPLQLDNNKWSLALYQLTKLGEWRLIKRYDKSQAHIGCKLEVVEQKGRSMAQAKGSKFCFVPYKYNPLQTGNQKFPLFPPRYPIQPHLRQQYCLLHLQSHHP